MSMLGEIFQFGPSLLAATAPVPSVARPPPDSAPVKFSALMDLLTARVLRAMPSSPKVVIVLCFMGGGVAPSYR
ncbi:hypothetical protein [Streptomyces sp. NPDC054834]